MRHNKGANNPNYSGAGRKICETCKEEFVSYNKTRHFCSRVCYGKSPGMLKRLEAMSVLPRKKRKAKELPNNKVCKNCGIGYRVKASHAAISNFCSIPCRVAQWRIAPKQCVVCGGDHVLHRKTCSPECAMKWRSLKQAGEKSHRWQGGKTSAAMIIRHSQEYVRWRTAVFERDNYICQLCGQRGGKLHADHINPFSTHPALRFELTNGRTLCAPCHFKTDTWGYGARRLLMEQRT